MHISMGVIPKETPPMFPNRNERYGTVSAKSSEFVYSFVICLLSKVLHARTAKMITQQLLVQLF